MPVEPISPPPRPLPALLTEVKMAAIRQLHSRLEDLGHGDIREGHGCVFGFIDMDRGSPVTELERLGYVERLPDPDDGRAKIIKLTDWGVDAVLKGRRVFAEIEAGWAEQLGPELLAKFREAATAIAELEGAPVVAAGRRRAA